MRSSRNTTSPSTSPLDNAFSPSYLEFLRERDDSLTAAEAELAGPWKIEPVPGRPGAVAILRIWGAPRSAIRPSPFCGTLKRLSSFRSSCR
jgi:hypothetical protein